MHARIHFGPIYHVMFHTYVHDQHVCSLNENTIYSLCQEKKHTKGIFFWKSISFKELEQRPKTKRRKPSEAKRTKNRRIKPKVIYRFDKITNDFIAVQHLIFTVNFKNNDDNVGKRVWENKTKVGCCRAGLRQVHFASACCVIVFCGMHFKHRCFVAFTFFVFYFSFSFEICRRLRWWLCIVIKELCGSYLDWRWFELPKSRWFFHLTLTC